MEVFSEPPELVEYRKLAARIESGDATELDRERYFVLAHQLVDALGPYSHPENVGVFPKKVAELSQLYPQAASAASQQCLNMGIVNSLT